MNKTIAGFTGVLLATVLAGGTAAFGQALDLDRSNNPSGMLGAKDAQVTFVMTEHDFGAILGDQNPRVKFKFRNTGTGTLSIRNIHASCGCTVPNLENAKREYQPGEEGSLEVDFHPKGKQGQSQTSVTIQTNDPERPQVVLTIRADVRPIVSVDPPLVQFADVRKGESRVVDVRVVGRTQDFAVQQVVVTDPSITAKVMETTPTDFRGEKLRGTLVRFSISPNAKAGNIFASATITTNDAREPNIAVQIMGRINGDLEISPPVVSLGLIEPGAEFARTFRVTNKAKQHFKILKAEGVSMQGLPIKITFEPTPVAQLTDPAIGNAGVITPAGGANAGATTLANPADKPWSYIVTVTGRAPEVPGMVNGDINVKTDVKAEEDVQIKFTGAVRQRSPHAPASQTQPQPVRPTSAPGTTPGTQTPGTQPAPTTPVTPVGGK
jgi:hypothetical protein